MGKTVEVQKVLLYPQKLCVCVCPLYQFSMQRNLQAIQQNRNLENVLVFGSTEVKRESFTQKILSRNSNAIEDLCSEYNFHLEIGLKSNCVSQGQARRRCDQETRMKRAQGKKYVFKEQQRTRRSKRSNADSSNKLTIQSRVERKTQEKETFAFVPSFYGRQCRLITVYYLSKIQL